MDIKNLSVVEIKNLINSKKYEILSNDLLDFEHLKEFEQVVLYFCDILKNDFIYTFNYKVEKYEKMNEIIDGFIHSVMTYLELCYIWMNIENIL